MEDVIIVRENEYDIKDYPHVNSHNKKLMWQRPFVQVLNGMFIQRVIYPKGDVIPNHTHHAAHGDFVVKGILHTSVGDFGPGDFVWIKEGYKMYHGASENEDVDVIFTTNKPLDMIYYDEPYTKEDDDSNGSIIVKADSYTIKDYPHINSKSKQWMYEKIFVQDEETGATVKRVMYPKGCMIPWHKHSCGHGCYVLSGKLITNFGTLYPHDFIWFQAGVEMYHGADDEDCDLLFMSNHKLDMIYLDK